MDVDEIHLTHQEEVTRKWLVVINGVGHNITKLASMFNNGKPCYPFAIAGGSFNYCIAVEFEDGQEDRTRWMIRLPIPGRVMDPETKIKHEAATMRYLYEKTNIPVPKVIASGTTYDNCFVGVGPFIIMEYIEGKPLNEVLMGKPLDELFRPRTVSEQLKEMVERSEAAQQDDEEAPLLSPDISDEALTIIYRQMANVYLELADHKFDKIGSLSITKTRKGETYVIENPPHTLDNNEQQRNGAVPADDTEEPFMSTPSYLVHLAKRKLHALTHQRNSIEDSQDAREKYTARHLLHALLPLFASSLARAFPLHCDDLRPHNILVNRDLQIVAIVDWEWTYAAPYEMFASAPRWLLLREPDEWTESWRFDQPGEDDLLKMYKSKLRLFLDVMKQEEYRRWEEKRWDPKVRDFAYEKRKDKLPAIDELEISSEPKEPIPLVPVVYYDRPKPPMDTLSSRMRASMDNGWFWLSAILQGQSMERLYWQRLDEKVFGERGDIGAGRRVSGWVRQKAGRKEEMEVWVVKKMRDLEAYRAEMGERERKEEEEREGREQWWEAVEKMGDGEVGVKEVENGDVEKGEVETGEVEKGETEEEEVVKGEEIGIAI